MTEFVTGVSTNEYFDEYQIWALTKKHGGTLNNTEVVATMALVNEAAEVQEIVEKALRKERVMTDDEVAHAAEELGDVLFYVAVLADHFGYDLSDIARLNVEKLDERHP